MHRQADAHRHPRGGKLLKHLEVDLVVDRAAAPLLRIRQAEQSAAAEQPELLAGEFGLRLVVARDRPELVGRDFPGEGDQCLRFGVGQQSFYRHAGPPLRLVIYLLTRRALAVEACGGAAPDIPTVCLVLRVRATRRRDNAEARRDHL